MNAEIISVGTELLLGHVINSDAAHIANLLADLGISLTNMQTVGDNRERLLQALRLAASRADIIFTTGGLGPTRDDLTKEVCAEFANKSMQENPELMACLKSFFGDRRISENQFRQALQPEDSVILPNSVGTAPGFIIHCEDGKLIVVLPGPPNELKPMLKNHVRPFLEQLSSQVIHSRFIRTFGIPEGEVDEKLGILLESANPTVAPYASGGEVFIKVTAREQDRDSAIRLAEPTVEAIKERLGDAVYGTDVNSLEEVTVKRLIERHLTVATAESCTGGLLAKRITDQPGASAVFHAGFITYSDKAKMKFLGVPAALLRKYGAVSEQVATSMANNVRKLTHSHFGIGITGIAGPDGATAQKPLGLTYIAVAHSGGCEVQVMLPEGNYRGRSWIRNRASSMALYALLALTR